MCDSLFNGFIVGICFIVGLYLYDYPYTDPTDSYQIVYASTHIFTKEYTFSKLNYSKLPECQFPYISIESYWRSNGFHSRLMCVSRT